MSDELAARLEESIRDLRPPIVGPARWSLGARLAEVVRQQIDAARQDGYKQGLQQAGSIMRPDIERLEREHDEAVRLLEEYPSPVPGDQYNRYSQYHAASEVWERKRDAFLARHKEAQGG